MNIHEILSIRFCSQNIYLKKISALIALLITLSIGAGSVQAAITVSAANSTSPARPGELLNIEFTIANTDGVARTGVVLTMVYPANLNQLFDSEYDGDCPGTTCTAGETATWTIGTLAAGGSVTVSFAPTVATTAPNGAVITFAPFVTDDTLDTDSAAVSVDVDSGTVYDLSLAENSDPAMAGTLLTYTVHFGFREDAAAVTESVLTFAMPANTTFVSASDGGSNTLGTVSWPLGFLSPGDGGVREVTVMIDGGLAAGNIIPANAEISAVSDPATNAEVQINSAITSVGGLTLAIESNLNPLRSTQLFTSALTVTNNSAFTRFGVSVTSHYPQNLNQLFESEFTGDCASTTCNAGERMTWALGDIPAGGSTTVFMGPIVSSGAMGGALIDFAMTASDTTGYQARRAQTLRVQNDTLYDLSLAENRDPAVAGSVLTFTIDFAYRQDAASVSNSMLRLPLPPGTSFVSASDGGTVTSGVVEWSLGFLSPGQSGTRTVALLLDAGLTAASVIETVARISSVSAPIERASAQANTAIAAAGGLRLYVESNTHPLRPGEGGNLQLSVCNVDGFSRFGITLRTLFQQDLQQQFESEFDGNCGGTTCTAAEALTWTLGDLTAGSCTTTVMPPVPTSIAPDGALIPFFMQAEDDQGVQTRRIEALRINSASRFDLALAEDNDPATAGSTLTYILTFGRLVDAGSVSNTTLSFPLPVGATFVSATDGGALNGGVVEWDLGFLAPGDGGQREVTVLIDAGLSDGAMVEAEATIFNVSTPLQNTRAEANTVVAGSNDLQVAIEANANPGRQSELINYRMTVSNKSAFSRFGVTVTSPYPQDLNQAFESEFDGNCAGTTCSFGERATWMLGELPAGVSRSVDLPPVIAAAASEGELINLFVTAKDDQDARTQQLASVRVQSDTLYDLAITVSDDPVTAGSTISYQLTYGYRADAGAVNDSVMRLPVPAGATFVSATGGGVFSTDTVSWSLGSLSPGAGGIVEAVVQLDGGLIPGTVVEAAAELYSVTAPLERARAKADTVIRSSVPLALDIDAITFTAEPNRRLNLQLTVTNNDPFTRFGVALKARFPQDLFQLFESDPEFDGNCGGTTCTATELIQWPLVDIPAGGSVTVTLPPTVSSLAVEGSLINVIAWVSDDQGIEARGSHALYNGCIASLDGDCDGIPDAADNCLLVANTNQRDTNGDGHGNVCDFDYTNNCVTNFLDLIPFSDAFGSSTGDANFNEDVDLDGNGIINFLDFGAAPNNFAAFFTLPPGPSASVCVPMP